MKTGSKKTSGVGEGGAGGGGGGQLPPPPLLKVGGGTAPPLIEHDSTLKFNEEKISSCSSYVSHRPLNSHCFTVRLKVFG